MGNFIQLPLDYKVVKSGVMRNPLADSQNRVPKRLPK